MIYKKICKVCRNEIGQTTDVTEALDPKCPKCGKEKMSYEPIFDEEISKGFGLDTFICNKETNEMIKNGFIMTEKDMGLSVQKRNRLFIKKVAECLSTLLKKNENINKLLGGK